MLELTCNFVTQVMWMDKTTIFSVQEMRQELILLTISEVVDALKFKGYNPTSQLVGYLITGDDKYITTFNNSRRKITMFNRDEILMAIINNYLGK